MAAQKTLYQGKLGQIGMVQLFLVAVGAAAACASFAERLQGRPKFLAGPMLSQCQKITDEKVSVAMPAIKAKKQHTRLSSLHFGFDKAQSTTRTTVDSTILTWSRHNMAW